MVAANEGKKRVKAKWPFTAPALIGAALLCVAVLGAGCAGNRTAPNAVDAATLVLSEPFDHLDVPAREPMIVEHPDGTLFVSGYGESTPTLWKSRDRGATWERVDVGSEASGALGNSDVDLAVAPDGTLYFASMVFDRKALEGESISIGVSRDLGATWSWTLLSKSRFDDRPWVEVGGDGTVHVIWNDGEGVCHVVSEDGGKSWTERARIHPRGGSSHLATGPGHDVAVRIVPISASGNKFDEGVDLVAVSTDGGKTWQKHEAPGRREWRPFLDTTTTPPSWVEPELPRWVEPLAWDADGALYSFWTNREGLWLARSLDRGATWKSWKVAASSGVPHFPYLVARARGELAATWFSGRGETLHGHAARLAIGDGDRAPRMIEAPPFRTDSWRFGERPEDTPERDTAGEYLALTFLRDGGVAIVSPIQNRRANRFGFSWRRLAAR